MQSAGTIRPERWTHSDDSNRILTPGDEYNAGYSEAVMTQQIRWIKKIGLGPVFFFVTAVCSSLLLIIQVASPAVEQGRINGATNMRLEAHDKLITDGFARLEAQQTKALSLAEQNRDEIRSLRTSTDGAFVELRQDTKALWKWTTAIDGQVGEIKGRVGALEAEIKRK